MTERSDRHPSRTRRLVRWGTRVVIGTVVTGVTIAGAMAVGIEIGLDGEM